ncbi:hypothetical protein KPH14_003686 [Odynerus spinipes]|uniref:Uncharacterized protein n=1 Tax=Odynerus spinipes TaxID=1348599 RepID=A0AAD9RX53_9HYME|nr:hypothetical protein KPH14_003686 [Odynerus spinipes]
MTTSWEIPNVKKGLEGWCASGARGGRSTSATTTETRERVFHPLLERAAWWNLEGKILRRVGIRSAARGGGVLIYPPPSQQYHHQRGGGGGGGGGGGKGSWLGEVIDADEVRSSITTYFHSYPFVPGGAVPLPPPLINSINNAAAAAVTPGLVGHLFAAGQQAACNLACTCNRTASIVANCNPHHHHHQQQQQQQQQQHHHHQQQHHHQQHHHHHHHQQQHQQHHPHHHHHHQQQQQQYHRNLATTAAVLLQPIEHIKDTMVSSLDDPSLDLIQARKEPIWRSSTRY